MKLQLIHLYPRLMNIYGDRGNILALDYRCQQRGIKLTVTPISPGDGINRKKVDLIFGGGGQDRQQQVAAADLQEKKSLITELVETEIPILLICGMYQLFGRYFKTAGGEIIPGVGVLDLHTVASSHRKIGNVIVKTNIIPLAGSGDNRLVGFENHSGNTFLGPKCKPLGKILSGFGNNGGDKTEGAVYRNTYGTYLHGSLLPKNPHLADHLILLALQKKYQIGTLPPLKDSLEWRAHQAAIQRTVKLKRRFWFF
jgi:hypothetical protein